MAYKHGISEFRRIRTNVAAPVMLENGVPVIFGTAPVNLAANPKAATNQLFLCKTFAEAVQNLGYSDDYESYTLCQAMDAFFKAFGVGPVVLCNVLDPEKHTAEYTEELSVVDGQAVSEVKGVLRKDLRLLERNWIQIIPLITTMMAAWYSLCLQVKQIRFGSLVKNWIRRR